MRSVFVPFNLALITAAIAAGLSGAVNAQTAAPSLADITGASSLERGSHLRNAPILEAENGFVPQIAVPVIETPGLSIRVREAAEILTPELVISVREPVNVSSPGLVIVVREPKEIQTPELVVVVNEPETLKTPELLIVVTEDEKGEGDENAPTEESGGAPLIGDKDIASGGAPSDAPLSTEPSTDFEAKRICVGEYTLHSAGAVGGGYGNPEMPVGTPVMAKATLTTDSCGAFLTMTSQGQSILLTRQDGDNVYVGELKMPDGVSRSLHLTCGRGLNMWGVLSAQDDSIRVRRPMWLQPVNTSTTTRASCVK